MKRIFALFAFLCSFLGYSQSLIVSAPILYATEDAHTYSGSTGTNYGTLGTMNVSVVTGPQVYRSFLKFNVTSIPSNAVITSAILRLTPSGTENVTTASQLKLDLANTSWTETGITNTSGISNNPLYTTLSNSTLVLSKREFEIKDWIQAMVEGRLPNNGFRLKKTDETTVLNTTYYTRENATSTNKPQLLIQYYLRPYVNAATIVHTSTLSSTDGSISPTVADGSNTTMSYRWFNSSGTQIATTQSLTGIGKGWYGLKYYGTTAGDTSYQAFIVGTECEDVSISFDVTANYTDDTRLNNLIQGSGTTASDYSSLNNGTDAFHTAERNLSSAWYSTKSLMRFRIWIDPACQVNTANLTMIGLNHNTTGATNASEMALNTSNWSESGVSWVNTPTSTATGKINLASIPTGASNLTVNIASFFNTWKTNNVANYGFVFQLQSYTGDLLRRMQFLSSDNSLANRPQLAFSIKVNTCDLSRKGTSTVTYDATNTYGDVALTITPPSWAVSPYQYMISEQPIPNFGTIYRELKDSVFGGVLDSVKFFIGDNNTSLTSSYTSLKQGQYYISAFDKLGARIYNNLVSINPINYESSSSISFANDVFTTSAANGKAMINSFLTEESENASLTFTVQNNTGESFFGLQNTSSGISVKTDILHGFQVIGSSARLLVNGVLGGTAYTVTAADEFSLVKDGAYLKFYISGVLRTTYPLPATYVYKTGVFGAGSATKIKFVGKGLKPFNFVLNRINPVVPGSCLGSFGQVSGYLLPISFSNLTTQTGFSTVLKNSALVAQTADAGSTAINYSFSNLLPGNYTLTVTYSISVNGVVNPTPVVLNYNVVVGSKISWENKVAAVENLSPVSGSTLFATSTGVWGHASSVNDVLVSPASTYVDFTSNIGGYIYGINASPPFISLITIASGTAVLGFGNPTSPVLGTTVPAGFTGYYFTKPLLGPYSICKIEGGFLSGAIITFNAGDKFRFVYNGTSSGSLYKYTSANVLGSMVSGSTITYNPVNVKKLIAYIKSKNNTGFINLSTNMLCPENKIYAKLERDLKGVKYSVNLNKFYFFYDEEYSSTTSLKYNVYDKNSTVVLNTSTQVLSQTISNQPNREYGDNRYYIDVTSLAAGSYVLEVINEKEEKFYLRFIK